MRRRECCLGDYGIDHGTLSQGEARLNRETRRRVLWFQSSVGLHRRADSSGVARAGRRPLREGGRQSERQRDRSVDAVLLFTVMLTKEIGC